MTLPPGRVLVAAFLAFMLIPGAPAAPAERVPSGVLARYAHTVRWYNPALTGPQAAWVAGQLLQTSYALGVDPRLVVAVIAVESRFNPAAISPRGAVGLGQLMPATAARLGVNSYDPPQNLYGTVRKLRELLVVNRGRLDLTLAGYNAGMGAVGRHRGVPSYRETELYVSKVLTLYAYLRSHPAWRPDPLDTVPAAGI